MNEGPMWPRRRSVAVACAALVAGLLLGARGRDVLVGKAGAHGHWSMPAAHGVRGRAVVVDVDGDDVLVDLDDALRVRVVGGRAAMRRNPARQAASSAQAFSYLEVAVTTDWAFVFTHAVRRTGDGWEVNGQPVTPVVTAGALPELRLGP